MGKMKDLYGSEDEIPEGLKEFYTETGDGWKFEGVDGQQKVSEFRNNNIELRRQNETLQREIAAINEKFAAIDVDQYNTVLDMANQMKEEEERSLLKKGKLEEVLTRRTKAMQEDWEKQRKAKDDALIKEQTEKQKLKGKLGELLIDREIQLNLSNAKVAVQDGALSDVLARARDTWQINENGQMVPVEKDPGTGQLQTRYGTNGEPLTMQEYVGGLVNKAAHLFRPSTGGGGSGRDGEGAKKQGQKVVVNMKDPMEFGANLEQIAKGNAVNSNE